MILVFINNLMPHFLSLTLNNLQNIKKNTIFAAQKSAPARGKLTF